MFQKSLNICGQAQRCSVKIEPHRVQHVQINSSSLHLVIITNFCWKIFSWKKVVKWSSFLGPSDTPYKLKPPWSNCDKSVAISFSRRERFYIFCSNLILIPRSPLFPWGNIIGANKLNSDDISHLIFYLQPLSSQGASPTLIHRYRMWTLVRYASWKSGRKGTFSL